MEKGMLIVTTFTSVAAIPLADTEVYISNSDDSELLAYRITNIDGSTDAISIDTPDLATSLYPSDERPFTPVNVYTSRPGYYRMLLENVQVFPEETSLQRIMMQPLPEFVTAQDLTKVIVITPQNL